MAPFAPLVLDTAPLHWRETLSGICFAIGCLGGVGVLGAEGAEGVLGAFLGIATGYLLSALVDLPGAPFRGRWWRP